MSSLSFLSMVLEKVVVNQLNSHINSSNTSNHYQSAERKVQSTETALLKVHNDILASLNAGKVTTLILRDLSAAFNTIDHSILLNRLDAWFGVTGNALDWFKSCLTGRCPRIKPGDCLSSKVDLALGVPHGSILGPLLFTLYTTPLSSMISGHIIPHHLYADDSQLYVSFASGDLLQHWMVYSHVWSLSSHGCWRINWNWTQIKLNSFLSAMTNSWANTSVFYWAFWCQNYSSKIWNLGLIFWQTFIFCLCISATCSSCFYHIWALQCIRCYLDLNSGKLLATALVSTRLNCRNSRLYGIMNTDLTKLQHIQNRLARVVTMSPPLTRSDALLHSLHWLPLKVRVLFKISLLTCKTLQWRQPFYIHSILATSLSCRSLRSNNDNSLSVPRLKTNTGRIDFCSCDLSVLNNLPLPVCSAITVATFKKYLKTHLFDLSFLPETSARRLVR